MGNWILSCEVFEDTKSNRYRESKHFFTTISNPDSLPSCDFALERTLMCVPNNMLTYFLNSNNVSEKTTRTIRIPTASIELVRLVVNTCIILLS
mmetsp:Transcript_166/g.432  ORF Transcript_166/g.432 Transcript_166/m.432 type:complete len:94 (+) Transcript_166:102-383(+)